MFGELLKFPEHKVRTIQNESPTYQNDRLSSQNESSAIQNERLLSQNESSAIQNDRLLGSK